MGPRRVALAYLHAFCAGNLEALIGLLADDLHFDGPFTSARSWAAYVSELRDSPPEPARFEVLHAFEEEDRSGVFFRYEKAGVSVPMALYCGVRDGRIHELRLYFDGRAFT